MLTVRPIRHRLSGTKVCKSCRAAEEMSALRRKSQSTTACGGAADAFSLFHSAARRTPGCSFTPQATERPRSMARPQACYTAGRCRVHCIAWFRSESWIGVRTATPQQDDPTSTLSLRAIRDGSLCGPAQPRASSTWNRATAGSTAPRRLRWLDIASSPSNPSRWRQP